MKFTRINSPKANSFSHWRPPNAFRIHCSIATKSDWDWVASANQVMWFWEHRPLSRTAMWILGCVIWDCRDRSASWGNKEQHRACLNSCIGGDSAHNLMEAGIPIALGLCHWVVNREVKEHKINSKNYRKRFEVTARSGRRTSAADQSES
jgi:hypothetical protein